MPAKKKSTSKRSGKRRAKNEKAETSVLRAYFRRSRSWANSFLFILPLLVIYEIGVACHLASANLAAEVVRQPLSIFGRWQALAFNGIVLAGFLVAFIYLHKKRELNWRLFPPMLLESALYGFILVPALALASYGRIFLPRISFDSHLLLGDLVIAAGAGVYEEIVFRGVLLFSIYLVATKALDMKPFWGGIASLVLAAAIFSAMHFHPATGIQPAVGLFVYFMAAGVLLSGIFLTRGLGIACYTHAICNIILMLSRG